MTTVDDKTNKTVSKTTIETKPRKRRAFKELVGNKGPLWLPQDVIPGFHLRWGSVTERNHYRLHQLLEMGYGPLSEEQKSKIYGLIPMGLITQTQTEYGSWITKQSGSTTHFLMCIPLEDYEELQEEKRVYRKEQDEAHVMKLKNNEVLTMTNLSVRTNDSHGVKTWE